MIHNVKIRSQYYNALKSGLKKFEIRKNDRKYKVGDLLALNEIDNGGNYTDRAAVCKIVYILDGFEGLSADYVALGVELLLADSGGTYDG